MSDKPKWFRSLTRGIVDNSLWLASLGLMLASSGIDGQYMVNWMPEGAGWLGYVLNTVSDLSGMVITYWWGRLRQYPKNTKRYRLAWALLPAEIVAVVYSWFFSWRQLRLVLPGVETGTIQVPLTGWEFNSAAFVAPIAAGFIPLLLAFIGYAQALLAGRIESEHKEAEAALSQPQAKAQATKSKGNNGHKRSTCPYCERTFNSMQAVSAHLRFCEQYLATQQAQAREQAAGMEIA